MCTAQAVNDTYVTFQVMARRKRGMEFLRAVEGLLAAPDTDKNELFKLTIESLPVCGGLVVVMGAMVPDDWTSIVRDLAVYMGFTLNAGVITVSSSSGTISAKTDTGEHTWVLEGVDCVSDFEDIKCVTSYNDDEELLSLLAIGGFGDPCAWLTYFYPECSRRTDYEFAINAFRTWMKTNIMPLHINT